MSGGNEGWVKDIFPFNSKCYYFEALLCSHSQNKLTAISTPFTSLVEDYNSGNGVSLCRKDNRYLMKTSSLWVGNQTLQHNFESAVATSLSSFTCSSKLSCYDTDLVWNSWDVWLHVFLTLGFNKRKKKYEFRRSKILVFPKTDMPHPKQDHPDFKWGKQEFN